MIQETSDKIINFDGQKYQINSTFTDFKSEVVAAGLLEQGFDPDRTLMVRNGTSKRGVSKDIENLKVEFSQQQLFDYLYIQANRAGIFDALPEYIFHGSSHIGRKRTRDEVLASFQQHRSEEFFARRFFKPLEVILDDAKINLHARERIIDKKNEYPNFLQIFDSYWPVLKLLPLRQAAMFLKLIPVIKYINNNFSEISQMISGIIGFPVIVEQKNITIINRDDNDDIPTLGNCSLGNNLVIGEQFRNGFRNIMITVGPIKYNDLSYFIPKANGQLVLQTLIDMIIPCDREIEIHFQVNQTDSDFISTNNPEIMPYLGITSYLT
jgi:hypothetical protein